MEQMQQIPFVAYEAERTRHDRVVKRMLIVIIICVALIVVSNLAWLYAWNQYDYTSDEIELSTRGGGNANYIGNDGDIINGLDTGPTQNP